ncbi:uncharacterized protein [Henckelia pumila]|uniref:uncharacterized protein isoform X2 n=1 Tax=Henckelia pumila TaxID=405737 RepID=UPI003C6E5054
METEVEGSRAGFQFPFWNPLRRSYVPDFPLFEAGNLERELLAKQVALELTDAEKQQIRNLEDGGSSEVFCPIVGCGAHLKSLEEFEDHYNARHQAKVARGFAMYECLVEGCGAKLMNYKSRQQHLIDKHQFPASFEFKKANPSKKHRQKFVHKKGSVEASSAANMQVDEDSMDTLVSAVSRLSTSDSPSSINFGRRHTRGFAFVPRAVAKERRQPSRSPAQTK